MDHDQQAVNQGGLADSFIGIRSMQSHQRETANKYGFRGVQADSGRKRFRAEIVRYGVTYRSRWRKTPEEAAREYDDLATQLYGPGCCRNYRDSDNRWLLKK